MQTPSGLDQITVKARVSTETQIEVIFSALAGNLTTTQTIYLLVSPLMR